MPQFHKCPRCSRPLTLQHEQYVCAACGGSFVSAPHVREAFLDEALSITGAAVPPPSPLLCPSCEEPMQLLAFEAIEVDRCESCGGVWLDAGEMLHPPQSPSEAGSLLGRYLLYSLSLPERAVRSTVGFAAGTAKEAAQFLVPQAFQNSKTYEVVIKNSLRFLTDDIGGVQAQPDDNPAVDNYMARKAVGNFVELAGMSTLHLSPIWILAVVSDVAYGTQTYVRELAEELKQQGLIDDTSTIHHADDVLEALKRSSGSAASLFDTPPLSVDELKRSLEETRAAAASADLTTMLPEAEVRKYWSEMRDIAGREHVSILGVSGALTMHSLGKLKTVSHGALSSVRVAGGLFNRHVIGHFAESLAIVQKRGFYETVRESYAPYVDAVWSNFNADRKTLTEEIVTGRALGKALQTFTGWFAPKPPPPESQPLDEGDVIAEP